jgi:methionine-rich copper-binding protein CopC
MNYRLSAFVLIASAFASASVFAHGKLEVSSPVNGSTVSPAPTELRLQFNEPVESAMSSIKLTGPGNKEVALDKVHADKDDAKVIAVSVPKLDAGDYRAEWATAGHDGHRVKGEIRFTVK